MNQIFYSLGDRDCIDGTDEREFESNLECMTTANNRFDCDEHWCYQKFSCGDGFCVDYYLNFPFQTTFVNTVIGCVTLRHIVYMCEMQHKVFYLWTLPNGKCLPILDNYREDVNKTDPDKYCIYLVKCAMSAGFESQCPCGRPYHIDKCSELIQRECPTSEIEYPQRGVIRPYLRTIYFRNRTDWQYDKTPDQIIVNGSIRCRGYQAIVSSNNILTLPYNIRLLKNLRYEHRICQSPLIIRNYSVFAPHIHLTCWSTDTLRLNTYAFDSICNESLECISNYRVQDGLWDCGEGEDHFYDLQSTTNFCSLHMGRYRLMCENKCLLIQRLGDDIPHCKNNFDEFLFGEGQALSTLHCNQRGDRACLTLRNYLNDISLGINRTNEMSFERITDKVSKLHYQSHCDTFWQSATAYDELDKNCFVWVCPLGQYQCRTGQCIPQEWICDLEWDCSDASDEQGLFILDDLSIHNKITLNITLRELQMRCQSIYHKVQPFFNYCNTSYEFPCLTGNGYDSLNFTANRPCISIEKIGDGHADCYGSLDERNTFRNCKQNMLGFTFRCLKSQQCLSSAQVCSEPCSVEYSDAPICMAKHSIDICRNPGDALCLNGTCAHNGRCDKMHDCIHGEDEFWCQYNRVVAKEQEVYRWLKSFTLLNQLKDLSGLPAVPISISPTLKVVLARGQPSLTEGELPYLFICNLGLVTFDGRYFQCFCPPAFYGSYCEFNSDRITVVTHLNMTNSNYSSIIEDKLVLKIRATFLFNNENDLDSHEFHIHPAFENSDDQYVKHRFYLLYSRSDKMIAYKRARYFNRSNIIHEHPYSVQFQLFELVPNEDVRITALWQYPIYLDFLPAFRLTNVLTFSVGNDIKANCSCAINATCISVLNMNTTKCVCMSGRYGLSCEHFDSQCTHFCAPHAFCQPNSAPHHRPTCICPHDAFGPRCFLRYTACQKNPCENNGSCINTYDPSGTKPYKCICMSMFYGETCTKEKSAVRLNINISDKIDFPLASVLQYYDIDQVTLELKLRYQHVEQGLPVIWRYAHGQAVVPLLAVLKLYPFDHQTKDPSLFLIYLQHNVSIINITTELSLINQCPRASILFNSSDDLSDIPATFKYHLLCQKDKNRLCFHDIDYFCVCEKNHYRVECFNHDLSIDQCSLCVNKGRCLTGNKNERKLCLCQRCYHGTQCEFSTELLSFTIDSLIATDEWIIQLIYVIIVLFLASVGLFTNVCSFFTFIRSNLRRSCFGSYLLIVTIVNQLSLLFLSIKFLQILFSSINIVTTSFTFGRNLYLCKSISYLLTTSTRINYWLISIVTIHRLLLTLFPTSARLKNPYFSIILIVLTILTVFSMHIHEAIFGTVIINEQSRMICTTDYSKSIVLTYNRVNVLLQHLLPVTIQIIAISILVMLTARSRIRAAVGQRQQGFAIAVRKQLRSNMEQYTTPVVIIISALPQTILSFTYACTELRSVWQRHILLSTYLVSCLPQILGFVLHVLPSTKFKTEFKFTIIGRYVFKYFSKIKRRHV